MLDEAWPAQASSSRRRPRDKLQAFLKLLEFRIIGSAVVLEASSSSSSHRPPEPVKE
jgi:hypothetical protein